MKQFWTMKNISFAYKHEPEILHITETTFPFGGATAIIGHNGAGKSTFARCLCGLEKRCKGNSTSSEQKPIPEKND